MYKYHFIISAKIGKIHIPFEDYSPEDATHFVVLGGDGHMLRNLSMASKYNTPILGINKGNIGFLMHHKPVDFVTDIVDTCKPVKLETIGVENLHAWNEIVLFRSGNNLIDFDLYLDDRLVNQEGSIKGDGLIISTQLGSSAYNKAINNTVLPMCMQDYLVISPINPYNYTGWERTIVKRDTQVRICYGGDAKFVCDGYKEIVPKIKDLYINCKTNVKAELIVAQEYKDRLIDTQLNGLES